VNDVPHIGHAYTTVAADVLARYHRLAGRDVHFLTGTDEHGQKIAQTAEKQDLRPIQLADRVVEGFRSLWQRLDISNDDFIRTTESRHEEQLASIMAKLIAQDDVYPGHYEGWYSVAQEQFITDSEAAEHDGKCPVSGTPLQRVTEANYFFRLSNYRDRLLAHLDANHDFIKPPARFNEVYSRVKEGLRDLAVSRPTLQWGIRMPNDPSHTIYVWVDALCNYITALNYTDQQDTWRYWPADVQLIGKDILWFHAVIWPCLLMALDVELPRCIFAHGWWTHDGRKMSKSLGNFVDPDTYLNNFGPDAFRYFLLREVPFGRDGDFSDESFSRRYNTELANDLGNLLSRTVNMIGRYCNGQVPRPLGSTAQEDSLQTIGRQLAGQVGAALVDCKFNVALESIFALAAEANRYIDSTKPFALAKQTDSASRERLQTVLYHCAESVRLLGVFLTPFMPSSMSRLFEQLCWDQLDQMPLSQAGQWSVLPADTPVRQGPPLFPRTDRK
jgi:methionyl-tRNA synthetase